MIKTIAVVVMLLGSAAIGNAQEEPGQTIKDSGQGRLWFTGINETVQDSKFPDASKFRVGAPFLLGESGGGGAFSWDVIWPSNIPGMSRGKRIEVALLTGAMNRQGGGEMGLFLTRTGTWGHIDDSAQVRIFEATSEGFEFRVPVRFSAGATLTGVGEINTVYSTQRTYALSVQDDGNIVQYQDVGGTWCPRWAIWQGTIPRTAWPAGSPCR